MRWNLALILLLALTVPSASQQEAFRRVEVQVTAIAGEEVYLDRGSDDGLQRGDRVELLPSGRPRLVGTIRSVARGTSRARFDDDTLELEVGMRGEVLVPLDRASEAAHPPWTHPPLEWEEERPLLAPVEGRKPEQRPVQVRGRAFTSFDSNIDFVADQTFSGLRGGLDLEVQNPLRQGGSFFFEADSYLRYLTADESEDDTTGRLRLDRFSYRMDVERGRRNGFEVGRFLHDEIPELGVLDGVDFVRRFDNGARLGASLGLLPLPTDEMPTGDDVGASVYYRHVLGEDEQWVFGTAYQKTWHQGHPDRDLLVGTVDGRPTPSTNVYATTLIDFYGAGDDLKDSPVEVTQLQLGGNWRTPGGHGLGVFLSHLRWPDIEREEFVVLPETVSDGFVTRYGVNGWLTTSERTRLSARVDQWTDESDDGNSASLRLTMRDLLFDRGEVSLETFGTVGEFSRTLGYRVGASRALDPGYLRILWSSTLFDQEGFVGGQESLLQNTLRAGYDFSFGGGWDLSLYAETYFGDEQDAFAYGFQLQRRF